MTRSFSRLQPSIEGSQKQTPFRPHHVRALRSACVRARHAYAAILTALVVIAVTSLQRSEVRKHSECESVTTTSIGRSRHRTFPVIVRRRRSLHSELTMSADDQVSIRTHGPTMSIPIIDKHA